MDDSMDLDSPLPSSPRETSPPPSLVASVGALALALEAQQAQMAEVGDRCQEHFERTLPTHLQPHKLIERLQALAAAVPALAARQLKLREARTPVLEEVERLMQANRALLRDMHTRVEQAQQAEEHGTPATDAMLASIGIATPSKSSSRPPLQPVAPIPAVTAGASTTPAKAGGVRRKSVRPSLAAAAAAGPPSPSDSSATEDAGPVSEREFGSVSSTLKSRHVKLTEVNALYAVIQAHFRSVLAGMGSSKKAAQVDPASLTPLTLTTLAELGGAGKIGGATSQGIIGTLRACKRITVDRRGILLVKLPPPQAK